MQALSNDLERRPDCHKKLNLVSLFFNKFSELKQLIFVEMRCPPSTHKREE